MPSVRATQLKVKFTPDEAAIMLRYVRTLAYLDLVRPAHKNLFDRLGAALVAHGKEQANA